MTTCNLRIKKTFPRPRQELVEAFRGIPVANIADCMNRMSCLNSTLVPMNKSPLLGVALTVKSVNGDNLLFHQAIDMAQPGDVIVLAGGGYSNRAYAGEIMVQYAISKGISGFVVDGGMRDKDAIGELDFPVYCLSITPNGPFKNGPGEINYPVSCAGQVIHPGDILVGDGDGVVVIRQEDAIVLAQEARKFHENEVKILNDILNNRGVKRDWIATRLRQMGFEKNT